jgi:predicted deacylase
VPQCDYGIDFHSAAVRRTNFPNVRGDLAKPEVARIARAFGCELIVNSKGPKGSLRRSACEFQCPTIILEAGEVWKIEPTVVECGVRGVRNVLIELDMVQGKRAKPPYRRPSIF